MSFLPTNPFPNLNNLEDMDEAEAFDTILKELDSLNINIVNVLVELEGNVNPLYWELHDLKENIDNLKAFVTIKRDAILSSRTTTPGNPQAGNDTPKIAQQTLQTPRISGLSEIAGLWEAKRIIECMAILPRTQPQLFANRSICNSLLLFGPPGTGKTRLVHAIAAEANAVLHVASSSNVLSSYVGESERNLKDLFDYLRTTNSFTILFIDEIDAFCKKRNNSEQEHSRRLKTELMCQLSRMDENPNAMVISVTNCPWDLDSAFLRRFNKTLYIPLPKAEERYTLMKLFIKDTSLEKNLDKNWEHIIEKTEGFSGSDIYNVIQQALDIPILELQDSRIWKRCTDGFYEPVTSIDNYDFSETARLFCKELKDLPSCSVRARPANALDLVAALETAKPTVPTSEIHKYEEFNKN